LKIPPEAILLKSRVIALHTSIIISRDPGINKKMDPDDITGLSRNKIRCQGGLSVAAASNIRLEQFTGKKISICGRMRTRYTA